MLYYDCLQLANEGDTRPFVRFIAHCTEKTLDVYLWATKEALPKLEQRREEREQHEDEEWQRRQQEWQKKQEQEQEQDNDQAKQEDQQKEQQTGQHPDSKQGQDQEEDKAKYSRGFASKVYLHVDDLSDYQQEDDRKFVFTPVEDILSWEELEERETSRRKTSHHSPSTPSSSSSLHGYEDHILMEGEEEEEEADVMDVDGRDHLWFVGEEERVRVRGGGKESRIGSNSCGSSSSSGCSSSDSGRIGGSSIGSSDSSSSIEHDKVIKYLVSEERLAAFEEGMSEGESTRGL